MSVPQSDAGPYSAMLLAHARSSRHQQPLVRADATAEAVNALCGDRITVMLALSAGRIRDYAFQAEACVLTRATASLLGDWLPDRTVTQVQALRAGCARMLAGDAGASMHLGELAALSDLAQYPARHACVLLPFAAVCTALERSAHKHAEDCR